MPIIFPKIALVYFLLSLCICFSVLQGVASLGINYGQVGNDLPAPEKVLELLRSLNVTKARIYDTNPQILTAFGNSNVELIVTVENRMLPVLSDPQQALLWVNIHVRPYFPATRITEIDVGNEVLTDADTTLMASLVPAMVSIHGALVQFGLDSYIHVSSSNSLAVLTESYPPSAGSFKAEVSMIIYQMLQFLSSTKSPFWINAYPYFAYKDDPSRVSLDYVLFNPNPGMVDPNTRLHYDNMLYAQVDAVVFAIARMGFGGIEVRVSETGWPSKGDKDEVGATLEYAAIYNKNLMKRQRESEGTPLRPNVRMEVYVFALFNEDMKPGPTSERNYGLFQPDGTMAYNVELTTLSTSSSSSPTVSLTSSATKLSKEAAAPTAQTPALIATSKVASATPGINYSTLGSFIWDKDNDKVKIYISLKGVDHEKMEADFKSMAVDIKIHDVNGKNYRCAIPKLNKEIVPEKCKVLVKTTRRVVTLVKASKGNWLDLDFKEDNPKPGLDKEKDPMAGIMDLMKNMYDEGDDEMKRTMAKAWTDAGSGKTADPLKGYL